MVENKTLRQHDNTIANKFPLLWNLTVHCHVCNSLLLVPIFSQLNSAHIAWPYFFMIHFNTPLPFTRRLRSGLIDSLATATGLVCGPVGQATQFFNANAVTPKLKYSHQPRWSARLKIPYSWTVIIHFISYYTFWHIRKQYQHFTCLRARSLLMCQVNTQ